MEQKVLEIENLTPINVEEKSGGIDFEKYHNKKTQIEKVEIVDSWRGYKNDKLVDLDIPNKQLLVVSKVLDEGEKKDGEKFEIRAKEWFNLIKKEDGTIGWSTHPKAGLQKFLKSMRVKKPGELVGKEILLKVITREDSEGQKKDVLRFMY